MSARTRLLLIGSLVLNLFLIGAGVGAAIYGRRLLHDYAGERPPTPLAIAARSLAPAVRERLKAHMRGEALKVRPDFDAARQARNQAAQLAAAPVFDRNAVTERLAEARQDETRARLALEAALLDFMQTASPEDRARLAPALKGRPPRRAHPDAGRLRSGASPKA